MARRAARVDANQESIVAALREIGASVQSLAKVGDGCPDILVGFRGANYPIELKDGSPFTPAQKRWHAEWNGRAYVANNIEEALLIIGANA